MCRADERVAPSTLWQRHLLLYLGKLGYSAVPLLCGAACLSTLAVGPAAEAATRPIVQTGAVQNQPRVTSFHLDAARLAALRDTYDRSSSDVVERSAALSPSVQIRHSSSLPPLNLANFVIIDPKGNATAFSGSISVPFGGMHTWQVSTVGYLFGFDDYPRTLAPGQYDTPTGARAFLQNDPDCNQTPRSARYEIDQANYDSSGHLTFFAIQFDFTCPDGTEALGTFAFQIQNTTPNQGYYVYGKYGDVTGFGNDSYLIYLGTPATLNLNAPIVEMVTTPDGNGYWMLSSDGGIFAYGDAAFDGSMGGRPLNAPVVGMSATTDGGGYWLVASDGGIFTFGDAVFLGSRGGQPLNRPIVGMATEPNGGGYWLVASDGGIFAYGGAPFFGSTGSIRLNKPVVAMTPTSDGGGYWFVATDGGIFDYGNAQFFGSAGGLKLDQPVVGILKTRDGQGYWLVATDGGIFTYGDATFEGSLGGTGDSHVAGIAA